MCCFIRCRIKRRNFKGAKRAIPNQRCRFVKCLTNLANRLWPRIQNHFISGHLVIGANLACLSSGKFFGQHNIAGQQNATSLLFSFAHNRAGCVEHGVLTQRRANGMALGGEEGVGHAPTNNQTIDLGGEVAQQVQLGRNLCATNHSDKRARGVCQSGVERVQLSLHRQARITRQVLCNGFG